MDTYNTCFENLFSVLIYFRFQRTLRIILKLYSSQISMKNAIILHIINNMKMIKSLIQLFLRGDFSFEPKKLIITLTGKSI